MSRIVIIGGGAVGLATAYALQREGHSITLLDRDQPGQACSLHNAGLLVPSHFIPMAHPGVISQGMKWMLDPESPFYIKPRLDRDLISWVWSFRKSSTEAHVHRSMTLLRDLCQTSLRLVREMIERDGLRFGLENRGLLMLFRTPAGREGCEEEAGLARTLGVEADVLDRAGLEKLEPSATFLATGGVYYPGDAHLSPSDFMHALTASIEKAGAKVLGGTISGRLRSRGESHRSGHHIQGRHSGRRVRPGGGSMVLLHPARSGHRPADAAREGVQHHRPGPFTHALDPHDLHGSARRVHAARRLHPVRGDDGACGSRPLRQPAQGGGHPQGGPSVSGRHSDARPVDSHPLERPAPVHA